MKTARLGEIAVNVSLNYSSLAVLVFPDSFAGATESYR